MEEVKITIFGAGYVGLTTALLFANSGLNVLLIEKDELKIKKLSIGETTFYEPGIENLLKEALSLNNLKITNDFSLCSESDFIFSCVGTPDNPDGGTNMSYVLDVAEDVSKNANDGSVFIQKSTVPVKTHLKVKDIFKKHDKSFSYVSNPEFLREGTAIKDSLWFDRLVVGGESHSCNKVIDLYKILVSKSEAIAKIAGIEPPNMIESHYIKTTTDSAELIKVTSNAFLAMKISFANSIAKIADSTGADIKDVMLAVGADHRIGSDFLNAGRGYGGGCFPKDVSGLISSAEKHGIDLPIMSAVANVNESMPGYIANKAQKAMGSLEGKKVAVLGLSFKANTSDTRRSPGVRLANILFNSGCIVNVYDPFAIEEAKSDLKPDIKIKHSLSEAVENTDAVFIATEWNEFIKMDLEELSNKMKGALFCDAINAFNISEVRAVGLQYIGVGRS